MKVRKAKILKTDLIHQYLPAHFTECLQCTFAGKKKITADDIMVAFWTVPPKWVDNLFKFRDILVKPFGLKGGNKANKKEFENSIRTGGTYNFMSILPKSEQETILCANDKHLVMYLSIKVEEINETDKRVTASTLVNFYNLLGRVYFFCIYPFHCIIVKAMLKSVLNRLKN